MRCTEESGDFTFRLKFDSWCSAITPAFENGLFTLPPSSVKPQPTVAQPKKLDQLV